MFNTPLCHCGHPPRLFIPDAIRAAFLTFVFLLSVLPAVGQAQDGPSKRPALPLPVNELQHLLSLEQVFANDLSYNYRLAEVALQQGELEKAHSALERIVIQVPTDLGARLDLALVCYQLGQVSCARQQLEVLLWLSQQQPAPVAAQQAIDWLQGQLNKQTKARKVRTGLWLLEAGYDSNANLGADRREIRLDLWGELPLTLQLADASLSTSDSYAEIGAMVFLPVNDAFPAWAQYSFTDNAHWLAGFNHREYRTLDDFEQSSLYGGVQWYSAFEQQRINLLLSQQWFGFEPYRLSLILDAERTLPGTDTLYASARYEWIKDQLVSLPNSHLVEVGLSWREQAMEVNANAAWQWRPERTAGNTAELGVQGKYRKMLSSDTLMTTYLGVTYTQDTDAYSPQFFGSVRRKDLSWLGGVELKWQLGAGQLLWDTSFESTHSSIDLNQRKRFVTRFQYRANW